MYVNALTGDLRLLADSQLINAGIDAPPGGTSALDADGAERIQGTQIDIGAYEQVPEPGASTSILSALAALGVLRRVAPVRGRSASRPSHPVASNSSLSFPSER
jgi:hypothetical protein